MASDLRWLGGERLFGLLCTAATSHEHGVHTECRVRSMEYGVQRCTAAVYEVRHTTRVRCREKSRSSI